MLPNQDEDLERINRALDQLGEHFDSVHIFATRHDPAESGGTTHINRGNGNWFARYGQIREWLLASDEENKHRIRRRIEREHGDE